MAKKRQRHRWRLVDFCATVRPAMETCLGAIRRLAKHAALDLQNLIGLIEDKRSQVPHRTVETMVEQMIVESPWGRHQDIGHRPLKLVKILLDVASAVHDLQGKIEKRQELLALRSDLRRKLSGWRNDKGAHVSRTAAVYSELLNCGN